MLLIVLIATLFAAGPIVAEHQACAAHHPQHKGSRYPNDLRGVAYGPCFQKEGKLLWSYTWCVKPGFSGGYR